MKTTKIIANILVTLAAIAGAVYVLATYGEQIAAWCKKLLASCPCCGCDCDCDCDCDCEVEITEAEEAPAEEAPAEEAPAEDAVDEADFEN